MQTMGRNLTTLETIEQKLAEAFAPSHLFVRDDSEDHRGHGGFIEDVTTHVHVEVTAPAFDAMSRIERQRAVMQVLKEELEGTVHALSMNVKGTAQ